MKKAALKKAIFAIVLIAAVLLGFVFFDETDTSGAKLKHLATLRLPVNAKTLAWHPDSKRLAAGGWSGMLTVWDAEKGTLIRDMRQPNNAEIGGVQYSYDGKFLAVGKSFPRRGDAYLNLFDADTLNPIDELKSPKSPKVKENEKVGLRSLSIDPSTSRRIALPSYLTEFEPIIFDLDAESGDRVLKLPETSDYGRQVAFTPDGRVVAVGRMHCLIEFYDSANGAPLGSLTAFEDIWWLRAMRFSPDGKYLVAASNTGMRITGFDEKTGRGRDDINREPIKMWDAKSLELVRTFDAGGRVAQSLDISADSRLLIAGLSKGYVDVWNLHSGKRIARFRPAKHHMLAMLSPDRKRLATSDTGTREIKIWEFIEKE